MSNGAEKLNRAGFFFLFAFTSGATQLLYVLNSCFAHVRRGNSANTPTRKWATRDRTVLDPSGLSLTGVLTEGEMRPILHKFPLQPVGTDHEGYARCKSKTPWPQAAAAAGSGGREDCLPPPVQ